MAEIQFHPDAREELSAAFDWYLARNVTAAHGFLHQVDEAIIQISERSEAWPSHLAGTRRFILRLFPFQVIYRIEQGAIQVVAVAHDKRRPGYWKGRAGAI